MGMGVPPGTKKISLASRLRFCKRPSSMNIICLISSIVLPFGGAMIQSDKNRPYQRADDSIFAYRSHPGRNSKEQMAESPPAVCPEDWPDKVFPATWKVWVSGLKGSKWFSVYSFKIYSSPRRRESLFFLCKDWTINRLLSTMVMDSHLSAGFQK